MRTLDSMVPEEVVSVRLLKIHVEGFEKSVLDGAARVLAATQHLYVETGDELSLRYGYSTRDLIEQIRSRGFDVLTIDAHGELRELDETFDPVRPGNVVARARSAHGVS